MEFILGKMGSADRAWVFIFDGVEEAESAEGMAALNGNRSIEGAHANWTI